MITRIQALNYRGLRYVDVALDRFHVLVGANASGKSTLFDVVLFVGDFVRDGLKEAIAFRTKNFQDLVWSRPREELNFELALEFEIPEDLRNQLPKDKGFHTYRYEIVVRERDNRPHVHCERGTLIAGQPTQASSRTLPRLSFPSPLQPPKTILTRDQRDDSLVVVERGLDRLIIEAEDQTPGEMRGQAPVREMFGSVLIDPLVSHLRFLEESRFPVSLHVYSLLASGVRSVFLDSVEMREPSTARFSDEFLSRSGAQLPWAIKHLQESRPDLYDQWLKHVQTILQELDGIRVAERPEDRARFLMLKYSTGVQVPSWMVSDGTLRFLATMLVAYLAEDTDILLLEEPENGIHPLALEAIYDALSSAFGSQVLVTTHAPTFLSMAAPEDVLCFARTDDDATDIVRGDGHPMLANWQESADTDVLFARMIIE